MHGKFIMLSQISQIYIVSTSVDMRKSINSLSLFVSGDLKKNPSSGDGFLFFNRARDKIKILYFSHNGFVLHYKRFEKERIKLPLFKDLLHKISYIELLALLAGFDIKEFKIPAQLTYSEF